MSSDDNKAGGIGIIGLLQVGLILAKVCNSTQMSWWWVFSPIIACIVIILILFILGIIYLAIKGALE